MFCTNLLSTPSGPGRLRRKSRTSAPKSAFSCGPGGGEKLFDPWAFGRKGQECPRDFRAKKFMFMLFFFPDFLLLNSGRLWETSSACRARRDRRRTNVQQLTCDIDLSSLFYYLFFSFVLLELKPFEGESRGKILKKCGKV